MTVTDIVRQGFHYARTCKSLWLFGFFVAMTSGGSNGGGRSSGGSGGGGLDVPGPAIAALVAVILVLAVASIVMRVVAEGALIEGVVRARQGYVLSTRDAFRAGWAHCGVVVRIALLYAAATVGSVALFVAPCVIAVLMFGLPGAVLAGVSALVVAVPWLVTLYLVQAFALRIAVLENRRALDAIAKARLFLHGRLAHGLRLLVATFIGSLAFGLAIAVVMAPVVLILAALSPVLRVLPAIVIGILVLLPLVAVLMGMGGTFRSSIWTIGYLSQVEA